MRCAALILAALSFVTGLLAAWYWYKSSILPVERRIDRGPKGGMPGVVRAWLGGIIASAETSAALNKKASIWTAATVILGTLANFLGLIPSN
jgi:hypothetical protein